MSLKKILSEKRNSGLCFVVFLCCAVCIPIQADTTQKTERIRKIECYSVLFEDSKQAAEPEQTITDSQGRMYTLVSEEKERLKIPERNVFLCREMNYPEVGIHDEIPETTIFPLDPARYAEESAEAKLCGTEYGNESWKDDLKIPITFHVYDADYYEIGEKKIPFCHEQPKLSGYEEDIFSMIGWDGRDGIIERYEWDGEIYADEDGILCRNAVAAGKRKVRDCRAWYGASVRRKEMNVYRLKRLYENREEVRSFLRKQENAPEKKPETGMEKIVRYLNRYLKVTVKIGALLAVMIGSYLIKRGMGKEKERRKNKEKEEQ